MTGHLARDYPERSTAMLRGFGRALDRASLAGGVVAVVSALIAPIFVPTIPFLFSGVAGALVGTGIGLIVARLLVPTGLLRAYEAFSWLGRSEMDRFQARTGSKVPVRRRDIERWLDENPASPPMQIGRIEFLAFIGRLDEARAELAAVAVTGPDVAFERASLAQYIGWLTDGDARLQELRAALAELPLDTDDRHAADVTIAIAEVRERFMRADPTWLRPLEAVRPSLGRGAATVVRRDTWRPLAIMYLGTALAAALVVALLSTLA